MLNDYTPLMTVQDVCEVLMVGKNTVYNLIKVGKINGFKIGRAWKINRNSLIAFIQKESGLIS